MKPEETILLFKKYRPLIMGIAYRFLGTVSDAEDVVQDVYIKWSSTNVTNIENPEAWLKTVCTRHCLDIIKSVERKRVDYVGTWLPEPIQTEQNPEQDYLNQIDIANSLTTAFIIMLERLTPKERAAYLLYEIFDTPYSQIAETLGIQENACRKLVSRAKINIQKTKKRTAISPEKQIEFINAFKLAISKGEQSHLQKLLTSDIVVRADGGGKVPAILGIITGSKDVLSFLAHDLNQFWHGFTWIETNINGNYGFIIKDIENIHAVVSFEFNDTEQASEIFIMRNPDKIKLFNTRTIL